MAILNTDALILIAVAAILSAMIHSMTGLGGGILMVAVLSRLIGIKQAVPAMACALLISHLGRALLYWRSTDWEIALRILALGCPSVIIGAWIFKALTANTITLLFVGLLVCALLFTHQARLRRIQTTTTSLSAASVVWGMLAGNVIGQGFFLAPFLLGTGMERYAFVGTLSTVTLVISILRLSVFGMTEVLTSNLLWLGVLIGILSIPGAWLGWKLLRGLSDSVHRRTVDAMTVLLIFYFLDMLAGG